MLTGNLLSLRSIEEEDLKQLRDWRNNAEFRRHFREHRELNMRQQQVWFEEKVVKDDSTLMFSIRRNEDDELMGCCGLVYINWVHRNADLSLYIGWEDVYIDTQGYADESVNLLLGYGFRVLGLHKIWTELYEFDEKKKKLFDRFGFKQDGVLRQNYWSDGKWWDSVIVSILAQEFLD
jgi:RimJ/RimL family protein N-acetyltransferase